MGTVIISTLQRGKGGTSPFPTNIQSNSRRAYVIEADQTAREGIEEFRRMPYMQCYQIDDTHTYRLGVDVTIAGQVWTDMGAVGGFQLTSEKNQPSGYVGLDADGFIDPQYVKSIYASEFFVVADEAERFALVALTGDIAHQLDNNQVYIKKNNNVPPTIATDWADITVAATVSSVNGMVGAVTIDIVGLLAYANNQAEFDAAVNATPAVGGLNSQVATNTGDIVAIYAILAGLGAEIPSIGLYSAIQPYDVDNVVIWDPGTGRVNLYRCTVAPPIGTAPSDVGYWEIVGDFFTQDEITALLDSKVYADGSIDTHSDVDITTVPIQEGQILMWITDEFVPVTFVGSGVSKFDNIYFVSPSGSDGTGAPWHPGEVIQAYLTVKAASLAAYTDQQSTNNWNQVYVFEGVYNEFDIAYPEIEMYFEKWAIIWYANQQIISDFIAGDRSGNYRIKGHGQFIRSDVVPSVHFSYSNTNVEIEGDLVSNIRVTNDAKTTYGTKVLIKGFEIISSAYNQNLNESVTYIDCVFDQPLQFSYKGKYTNMFFKRCEFNISSDYLPGNTVDVLDKDGNVVTTVTINNDNIALDVSAMTAQQVIDYIQIGSGRTSAFMLSSETLAGGSDWWLESKIFFDDCSFIVGDDKYLPFRVSQYIANISTYIKLSGCRFINKSGVGSQSGWALFNDGLQTFNKNVTIEVDGITYSGIDNEVATSSTNTPFTTHQIENKLSKTNAAPTIAAAVLDIDFNNQEQYKTTAEVAATADFSITLSNTTNAQIATIDLFITNTVIITLPANSIMEEDDTRWNSGTLELTIPGATGSSIELSLNKVGTKLKWISSQIFS